jgi:hypothetical protein
MLALLLLATKKLGEFVLSFCSLLLLGYGIYLLLRGIPKSGFLRCDTPSLMP